MFFNIMFLLSFVGAGVSCGSNNVNRSGHPDSDGSLTHLNEPIDHRQQSEWSGTFEFVHQPASAPVGLPAKTAGMTLDDVVERADVWVEAQVSGQCLKSGNPSTKRRPGGHGVLGCYQTEVMKTVASRGTPLKKGDRIEVRTRAAAIQLGHTYLMALLKTSRKTVWLDAGYVDSVSLNQHISTLISGVYYRLTTQTDGPEVSLARQVVRQRLAKRPEDVISLWALGYVGEPGDARLLRPLISRNFTAAAALLDLEGARARADLAATTRSLCLQKAPDCDKYRRLVVAAGGPEAAALVPALEKSRDLARLAVLGSETAWKSMLQAQQNALLTVPDWVVLSVSPEFLLRHVEKTDPVARGVAVYHLARWGWGLSDSEARAMARHLRALTSHVKHGSDVASTLLYLVNDPRLSTAVDSAVIARLKTCKEGSAAVLSIYDVDVPDSVLAAARHTLSTCQLAPEEHQRLAEILTTASLSGEAKRRPLALFFDDANVVRATSAHEVARKVLELSKLADSSGSQSDDSERIRRLLDDSRPTVRSAAVHAYAAIAGQTAEVELRRLTQDQHAGPRQSATCHLLQYGQAPGLEALVEEIRTVGPAQDASLDLCLENLSVDNPQSLSFILALVEHRGALFDNLARNLGKKRLMLVPALLSAMAGADSVKRRRAYADLLRLTHGLIPVFDPDGRPLQRQRQLNAIKTDVETGVR